jgi:hypothetical protein
MRGAMPTHLGANPRNHVNHDTCSSLENFYFYIIIASKVISYLISDVAAAPQRATKTGAADVRLIRREPIPPGFCILTDTRESR